jgi:putative acetyltransferase
MKKEDILIRGVEPGDLPGLADVWNQPRVVWGTLQIPHTSVDARQKRHAAWPPGTTMLAAVRDEKIVGSAGLHPMEGRRRAHVATIGMAVHDAYAGRGVGTVLLAAVLEVADKWLNFKRIELTVWSDNTRAIGLYERAGFEREGVLRRYAWRDGDYADAIAMARLRGG